MRTKTESLRQDESKKGKELESREVQGMCLWHLKTEMMSRWRFTGGDIRENQHEEDRMRDIHNGKTEAASEEQPDKLRKTVRFEQEASSASASSDPTVNLEYLASGETQRRPGSVFVRKSSRTIFALDAFYEMDGRKSRYIGEVLD